MKFEIIPNEQTPFIVEQEIDIKFINDNREMFDAFLEFASVQFTAVGLAANQCSLDGERFNYRVFAHRNAETRDFSLMFNPVILEYIGMSEAKLEGCLTWKGYGIYSKGCAVLANRFRAVKVQYMDSLGTTFIKTVKGFDAQIWQHEINHLNGVLEVIVDNTYHIPKLNIGRNDKCPCGSGKKYKQCCIDLV